MSRLTNISIVLLIVISIGCASTKAYFLNLSDFITKNYVNKSFQKKNLFKEAREKVYYQTLFLRESKNDTIFVLEKYDLEVATVYGRIWTSKNNVNYAYRRKTQGNELNLIGLKNFANNTIDLVTRWDTVMIRKLENDPHMFRTGSNISAYRCFVIDNKIKVEHIAFKDVFDPKNIN